MDFLKKYRKTLITIFLVVLFAVVGVPLIINWMFTIPAICKFFAVNWNTDDALGYYGEALGFLGTVVFSGLALWQNHVIKTESNKHTALLEKMEKQKNMPVIYCKPEFSNGNASNLHISLMNLSDNIASNIVVNDIKIINRNGSIFWADDNEYKIDHLTNRSNSIIPLKNPGLQTTEQTFLLTIYLNDKFGEQHLYSVEGIQSSPRISNPTFTTKEI